MLTAFLTLAFGGLATAKKHHNHKHHHHTHATTRHGKKFGPDDDHQGDDAGCGEFYDVSECISGGVDSACGWVTFGPDEGECVQWHHDVMPGQTPHATCAAWKQFAMSAVPPQRRFCPGDHPSAPPPPAGAPPEPPAKRFCPHLGCAHVDKSWWGRFDKPGMVTVPKGGVITGLWRNAPNHKGIYAIEEAKYRVIEGYEKLDCLNVSIRDAQSPGGNFDAKGWAKCPVGYYVSGIERSKGQGLHNLEGLMCCKPKNLPATYKACQKANWWASFDRQGWSECPNGAAITGLFRNGCDALYCLEEAMCCQMHDPSEVIKGCPSFSAPEMPPNKCPEFSQSTLWANWWGSFDRTGWSKVPAEAVMSGLMRTGGAGRLFNLEEAEFRMLENVKTVECKPVDITKAFDKNGTWVSCPDGCFMRGIYRTGSIRTMGGLSNMEQIECCGIKDPAVVKWGACQEFDISNTFNRAGTVRCPKPSQGLAGLYRGQGNTLNQLGKLKCCELPSCMAALTSKRITLKRNVYVEPMAAGSVSVAPSPEF